MGKYSLLVKMPVLQVCTKGRRHAVTASTPLHQILIKIPPLLLAFQAVARGILLFVGGIFQFKLQVPLYVRCVLLVALAVTVRW